MATAARLLRVIALANFMYCLLTIVLVAANRDSVTGWGVAYFLAEVTVIVLLARREWRVGLVAGGVA